MTTRALPTVEEVRERLEAAGHYVTIDGRVTEQTAASLIPCPASLPRQPAPSLAPGRKRSEILPASKDALVLSGRCAVVDRVG